MNTINEEFLDGFKPELHEKPETVTVRQEPDLFMLEICFRTTDVPNMVSMIKRKTHFILNNTAFTGTKIKSIKLEINISNTQNLGISRLVPDSIFGNPLTVSVNVTGTHIQYFRAFCKIMFHTTVMFHTAPEIINTVQCLTLQDKDDQYAPKFIFYCYPLRYRNPDKLLFHRKYIVAGEMRDAFNISREKSGWFYQNQFEQFWYTYIDDETMLKKLKSALIRKGLRDQWYILFTEGQPLYRE